MNGLWVCYLPILMFFFILLIQRRESEKGVETMIKRKKGDSEMRTIAQRFIGKDVLMSTVGSGSFDGVLKEVSDNAAVLEKNGEEVVVNLDYVIRLREYPKNKKGKRKSIVSD